MQLASVLSVVELVEVGIELCATYAVDPREATGMRNRVNPLLSTTVLRRCAAKMAGSHGAKTARSALRYIADGSASPMETTLTMLLCLSRAQGGYGLPMPQLNRRVNTRSRGTATRGKVQVADTYRLCDLYWSDVKLGVEFDSSSHHTGESKISRDADRRSELGLVNVSIITVTGGQLFDSRAFDRVARLIAKTMGAPLRIRRNGWMTKRFELRSQLLTAKSAAYHQYAHNASSVVGDIYAGNGSSSSIDVTAATSCRS